MKKDKKNEAPEQEAKPEVSELDTLSAELVATLKDLDEVKAELEESKKELDSLIATKNKDLNAEYIKAVSAINESSVARANTQVKNMKAFSSSVAEINKSMIDYAIDIKKTKIRSGVN